MKLSIRQWRPGQLLLGWAAYWAGLVGVTLGPAIGKTWRATQLPSGHGSVNASFDNGTLKYAVIENGVNTWVGSAPFSTVILWLVGPPLVLWLVWLLVRERPKRDQSIAGLAGRGVDALPGPAATEWEVRRREPASVDRGSHPHAC